MDEEGETLAFSNIIFVGSTKGTVAGENGEFYLETKTNTYKQIQIFSQGYISKKLNISGEMLSLKIVLKEDKSQLDEVRIFTGRVKAKNNPAVDILKKIWSKRRKNGVKSFRQYEYDKYEKLEFDLNEIDSTMMNSKLFKGMELIFDHIDTSAVTGKSYLPIFINESVYKVYGRNKGFKKQREDLIGNKSSGFDSNQYIISFVKDLYAEYDVYKNYIKVFDKSFVSPLSRAGTLTYNYILADSAFIKDKWCYNIVYYPRRKNELTFKGDFWVNDTTFAIKEINLKLSKSANINWVKDLYIEQEFNVLNDSVFLLERDYLLTDFNITKKGNISGMYGKRTTMYKNYKFDKKRSFDFYTNESDPYVDSLYNKDTKFWAENRQEKLNKDETGVYKMLDTLSTIPKFKRLTSLMTILASGYVPIGNFDLGSVYSLGGYNEVEQWRIRLGGRTYFGQNDLWRLQFFTAYGFGDKKFKYGFSGKWLFKRKNRWEIGLGNRKDIEQIGVSLTSTNDILGRSLASSSIASRGSNSKLTWIDMSSIYLATEPIKNLQFRLGMSYRELKSASDTFNLDYFDENNEIQSKVKQAEANFTISYMPGRNTVGNGVERYTSSSNYATLRFSYSKGVKGILNSDLDYEKLQFYYRQPFQIGGVGRLFTTIEIGKTNGTVPLSMLSIVPGNQSYMQIKNTFSQLNYYDFVTDTYASLHLEQNFNGRIFNKIPLLKSLNLRELVGFRAVWGSLSDANIAVNKTDINDTFVYRAPTDVYWEYSLGIGNILRVFRIDFSWKGSYKDLEGSDNFGIKGSFGFYF